MNDVFADAIERLFAAQCGPQQVRAIEAGGAPDGLWQAIEESGFADSLVAEAAGGAGLGLAEVVGILSACGGWAVPVPLGLTMLVRAVLAQAGRDVPKGPITVATGAVEGPDGLRCDRVPYALVSQWALVDLGDGCALLPIESASVTPTGVHGSLEGHLSWPTGAATRARFAAALDWRAAAAALMAAQMAGAMERVFADTVRYANERSQFGRSIGKFQAIQQQISVMAELVFAARMAARMGCASPGVGADPLAAAMAKARTSEAAGAVAAIAHAVHGAMGIAEEYDLQLFTRRLHEWRLAFGSETYWNRRIGEAVLGSAGGSVDVIRERLSPEGSHSAQLGGETPSLP